MADATATEASTEAAATVSETTEANVAASSSEAAPATSSAEAKPSLQDDGFDRTDFAQAYKESSRVIFKEYAQHEIFYKVLKADAAYADADPDKVEVVSTVCRACIAQCTVLAHVRDGRVIKLEGDPRGPEVAAPCARRAFRAFRRSTTPTATSIL